MSKEAQVSAIFTTYDKGLPMNSRDSVVVIPHVGLVGDRYASGRGAWSKKGDTPRHITIISEAAINESGFTPEQTRRNVVVTLGVEDLNGLVGKEFEIGGVRMRGVKLCTPCDRPSEISQKKGFKEAFEGKGGVIAEVLSWGRIQKGSKLVAS